ncbi:MAG: hypothetical protein PHE06_07990 [Lachnospiraceae bacterium]|nr:hypothetical protein [Lachnospiraceae bacterium]MDD3795892.1 hypothetical protein [Lachnospiraceae bacterium]
MDENDKNIMEELDAIKECGFNLYTLLKDFKMSETEIQSLMSGDIECFTDNVEKRFEIFYKIHLLYEIIEHGDEVVTDMVEKVIFLYGISYETIAKLSKVEVKEVKKLLNKQNGNVSVENKYAISATALLLYSLLQ